MKHGDISNVPPRFVLVDADVLIAERVPRWREVLGMGKTRIDDAVVRSLHRLLHKFEGRVQLALYCFKGEEKRTREMLEEHYIPAFMLFPIDAYEDIVRLPLLYERVVSDAPEALSVAGSKGMTWSEAEGHYT